MPISVRLPAGTERKLADYCMANKVSRSETVRLALEGLLETKFGPLSQDPLFRRLIGSDPRPGDVARHTKHLLRARPMVKTRGERP